MIVPLGVACLEVACHLSPESPVPPKVGSIAATYFALPAPSKFLFPKLTLIWIPLSAFPSFGLVPSSGSIHDFF